MTFYITLVGITFKNQMVKKELGGGVDMESHITEHHLSKIMVLVGFFFLKQMSTKSKILPEATAKPPSMHLMK